MSKKGLNRWFVLFILALACGLIYQLPYLRYSYYDAMLVAFDVTNTQLGTFMTAFGLGSLVCYLVGGVVAMKFSDKSYFPSDRFSPGPRDFGSQLSPLMVLRCSSVFSGHSPLR